MISLQCYQGAEKLSTIKSASTEIHTSISRMNLTFSIIKINYLAEKQSLDFSKPVSNILNDFHDFPIDRVDI